MDRKILLLGFVVLAASLLLCQMNAGAVVLDEKEAIKQDKESLPYQQLPDQNMKEERPERFKYTPGEIIVKFRSKAEGAKAEVQRKDDLKIEGNSIKRIPDLPDKVKAIVKDDTILEPLFKGLHNKMRLKNKTEEALNKETFKKLSKNRTMPQKEPKNYNLSNVYILKNIDTKDKSIEELCEELEQDPDIEYAEPNYIMRIHMLPNDPYYSSAGSWGQPYDDLWGIKKIQCEEAWDISQGEGVIVAVIDTGVDYNHPDLTNNIWINQGEIPDNNIDDDGNGYKDDYYGHDFASWCFFGSCAEDRDPYDEHGHGTHVAGTIAAVGNNGSGIIGIAPEAKIMAVKGLDSQGSGSYSSLAVAIHYAVDNGADVLSCSWGGEATSSTLEDAFDYAWAMGCISIAAAGNENNDARNFTPANIDSVIAVAAVTQIDKRCYFSNYGPKVEIAAPGGAENSWMFVDKPTSSGGAFARNDSKYARISFHYNSSSAPYNITLYSNAGPNNDDLDYWVYRVQWSPSDERWLIKEIYNSGTIACDSTSLEYHIPTTITINNTGDIMLGIRKKGIDNRFIDIDAIEVKGVTYEEDNPEVSLADFEYQGILSLRANDTDMYKKSLSNPEFFNPTYPDGLMIVPESDPNGILYRAQGTSMACPHASGVAALIFSRYPDATNDFIRNVLKYSCDNIDYLNPGFEGELGAGRINAYRAATIAVPTITSPKEEEPLGGVVTIQGFAWGSDFKEYQLFFYPEQDIASKQSIGLAQETPVFNGDLGVWDTTEISEGIYILRLELKTQDNALRIDEKKVLVNVIGSRITVIKDGMALGNREVMAYNSAGNLLDTLKTDDLGQVSFYYLSGSQIKIKVAEAGITSVKDITTPEDYIFNLRPSIVSVNKDGAPLNRVDVYAYKDSTTLGSISTDAMGIAKVYLDNGIQAKFKVTFSGFMQESEILTTPITYSFNFATCTVRVLSAGAPLSGKEVKTYDNLGNYIYYAYTDSNGNAYFYFKPGIQVNFKATHGGLTLNSGTITAPGNTEIIFPTPTVVTIQKYDNSPVSYLWVEAWQVGGAAYLRRDYTDSNGRVSFCFPDGTSVYFKTTAYLGMTLNSQTITTPNNVAIQFPQPTEVTVKNANSPLSYVYVYAYEGINQIRIGYTDSNGRVSFCFSNPSSIRFKARYNNRDYYSPIMPTPSVLTIDVSSYTDITISGAVRNINGQSFSFANVGIYTLADNLLIKQTLSDYPTGKFTISLLGALSGQYRLMASKAGYATSTQVLELNQGNNYNLDFTLIKAFVYGNIKDRLNKPIADAKIIVVKFSNPDFTGTMTKIAETMTDINGYYAITQELPQGAYRIMATYSGLYPEYAQQFVNSGQSYNFNFTLREQPLFFGIVMDNYYKRLPGVTVTLKNVLTGALVPGYSKISDSMGVFKVYPEDNVPAGTYNVICTKNGYFQSTYSQNIKVTIPGNYAIITMNELINNPATLKGYVKDMRGNALSYVNVILKRQSTGYQYSFTTSSTGYFIFNNMPPEAYKITASKSYYNTLIQDIALNPNETREVTLNLTPSCAITGTVTDQITGLAIYGTKVELLKEDGTVLKTYRISYPGKSYYFVTDILAGTYKLKATATGYQDNIQTITFTIQGERKIVDIKLVK